MNESELRDEICRVGRSLHARGYVHGSTGNISARLEDGFLITATDASLGELDPPASPRSAPTARRRPARGRARPWRCTGASMPRPPTRAASSTPIRATSSA
jgi:hypothetical protein